MRTTAGFSIIEILVVVSLLGLMTVIATVRAGDARVRSRVARVQADFHLLAKALEAFKIDRGSYPGMAAGGVATGPLPPGNARQGFACLISPVAYVESIPLNPFGDIQIPSGQRLMPLYEMGAGKAGVGGHPRGCPNESLPFYPVDIYMLESHGPDGVDDTSNPSSPVEFARLTGSLSVFPTGGWSDPRYASPEMILTVVYDPTNGTMSPGQMFRSGGAAGDTEILRTFVTSTRH